MQEAINIYRILYGELDRRDVRGFFHSRSTGTDVLTYNVSSQFPYFSHELIMSENTTTKVDDRRDRHLQHSIARSGLRRARPQRSQLISAPRSWFWCYRSANKLTGKFKSRQTIQQKKKNARLDCHFYHILKRAQGCAEWERTDHNFFCGWERSQLNIKLISLQ